LLLGFTSGQVAAGGVAFAAAVGTLSTWGWRGLLVVSPLLAVIVATGFVPVAGRTAVDWIPVVRHYAARRRAGQLEFRRRVGQVRKAGVLALPGDAAATRLHVTADGTAMLLDPHAQTLTAVVAIKHPAFVLLDSTEQEQRAMGWATGLAGYCQSGRHIARVQIMERTVPASAVATRSYWDAAGVHDGSWAHRSYEQLIATARPDALAHQSLVALTLDVKAAGRVARGLGRGLDGWAAMLRQRMDGLHRYLANARMEPMGWLGADALVALVRSAYDPASTQHLDAHRQVGRSAGVAGPVAVTERWNHLVSDSAYHAVLMVNEWPRVRVEPGFLWPLILSSGVQRTFSLVLSPQPTQKAIREAQSERVQYQTDRNQRAKAGMIDSFAHAAEQAEVEQREAELVAGHGSMQYVGLIVVSATSLESLDADVEQIRDAAATCNVDVVRLYGEQAQGFVAGALPLGRGL
ncbi:MAG: PrgI family protein, partial [Microbacterium sp.]